jgi:hypothetical protein
MARVRQSQRLSSHLGSFDPAARSAARLTYGSPLYSPEYPEGRGDLFRAFGLADAIFPGAGRGLEQHNE